MTGSSVPIAVIGGSGLYHMQQLQEVRQVSVDTPWGRPSDEITIGKLEGTNVAFLPRHARGHKLTPDEVPMRANIWALKSLGVRWIISVSACGSLREDYRPGDIVIPSGLFDHTKGRVSSFFGSGVVAHVSLADPFCPVLSKVLEEATRTAYEKGAKGMPGSKLHVGGKLICINGPRFSTKAESHIFRQWGLDLINMTTCPEAFLAREAEIAYAVMNHVTDYDCWHVSEEPVTVEKVIQVLTNNVQLAQESIIQAVKKIAALEAGNEMPSPAWNALKDAIISSPENCPPETKKTLQLFLGKYWS
eukprot:tig00001049_g6654.t1